MLFKKNVQLGSYQELCLNFPKYICDSYDVVFVFASDVFLQLKIGGIYPLIQDSGFLFIK
jgi:hypothetical protein